MYRRVTVVGTVCVSVKSHLTSGVSVHPVTTVMYSAGNGGQNTCGLFFETALFKSYGVKCERKSQYANLIYNVAGLLWFTCDHIIRE